MLFPMYANPRLRQVPTMTEHQHDCPDCTHVVEPCPIPNLEGVGNTTDFAMGQYAAALRYILRDPNVPIHYEDANAGTCAVATLHDGMRVWFGGDAAEEGWIGCSVYVSDENGGGGHDEIYPPGFENAHAEDGVTDQQRADAWAYVRDALPGVLEAGRTWEEDARHVDALRKFADAATALLAVWSSNVPTDAYPESFGSFDEVHAEIAAYAEAVCPRPGYIGVRSGR